MPFDITAIQHHTFDAHPQAEVRQLAQSYLPEDLHIGLDEDGLPTVTMRVNGTVVRVGGHVAGSILHGSVVHGYTMGDGICGFFCYY